MEEDNIEEQQFQPDEVEKQIIEIVENTLLGQPYDEQMVPHWIDKINEKILDQLVSQNPKPYKYIVNSMIMQRNGAGGFAAASCYWDSVIDGCCVVKWPKDKESKGEAVKNHMNCLVTVFASSLIAQH